MSAYITFGGQPCSDARTARLDVAAQGFPVPKNLDRANSISNPLGESHARGWFLLSRARLDLLDLNALHDVVFGDDTTDQEITFHNLAIVGTCNLTPGQPDDPAAKFMVEVADQRWLVQNLLYHTAAINRQYNVRAPGWGGAYYDASTSDGAGTAWTWEEVAEDLWEPLTDALGTFPGLPITPGGTPEGWQFIGVSVWQALSDLLWRIGCAVRCDLTSSGQQYTIVQVGASDGVASTYLAAAQDSRAFDREHQDSALYRAPDNFRVFFQRTAVNYGSEETTAKSSAQWTTAGPYSVLVANPGGVSGNSAVHPIWDDLPALYNETGSLTNAGALATRAAERVADFARMVQTGGDRLTQMYLGLVRVQPGSTIRGVTHRQCGWPERDLRDSILTALRETKNAEAFRKQLIDELERPVTTGMLVTEVVRHPYRMLAVDNDGQWSPCCTAIPSTSIRSPDYNPTFPVYPHLAQTIHVVTAAANADGLFDAYVERLDSATAPTWTDRERVWGIEMNGRTNVAVGRYPARLASFATSAASGRPVYEFRSDVTTTTTSTTTTTTTTSPCGGTCTWTWSQDDCRWYPSTDACTGVSCICQYPQFCGYYECEHTSTNCARTISTPPACLCTTSTTTSTTSTTTTTCQCITQPGCAYECVSGSWVKITDLCTYCAVCCCYPPAWSCTECEAAYVDCVPCTTTTTTSSTTTTTTSTACPTTTTPMAAVCGTCQWQSVYEQFSQEYVWSAVSASCSAGCQCIYPFERPCQTSLEQFVTTNCGHASTTSTTSTTTTSNACANQCYWRWNSALNLWAQAKDNCVHAAGCGCVHPTFNGTVDGQIAITYCYATTSTTSTTTTTSDCTGFCAWSWDGAAWNQTSNTCSAGCGCVAPVAPGLFIGDAASNACV